MMLSLEMLALHIVTVLALQTPASAPEDNETTPTAPPASPAASSPDAAAPAAEAPADQPATRTVLATCTSSDIADIVALSTAHPVVEVAAAKADALLGQGRAESSFMDPSVFFEARGLPISEPWNIGRTPMGGLSGGVMGRVPMLPKLWAKEDVRAQQADALRNAVGEQSLDLSSSLMMILIERDVLDARIDIANDRAALMRSLSMVARANAMVGLGGAADAVLLEARAARVVANVSAMIEMKRALSGRWRAVGGDVTMPQCRLDAHALADGDACGAGADHDFAQRPRLKALDAQARVADAMKSAAQWDWVPEPTLKAGYTWRADYGMFDGVDFVGGMIQIPLPVAPGRRLGVADRASAIKRKTDAERRAFLRNARGMYEALTGQIAAQDARITQLRDSARPVAQSASAVAQASYKVGKARAMSVIEAERLVLDIDRAIVDARATKAMLLVRRLRLVGDMNATRPDARPIDARKAP